MKNPVSITLLLLFAILIFAACNNSESPQSSGIHAPTADSSIAFSSAPSEPELVIDNNLPPFSEAITAFDEVVERYREIGYVRYIKPIGNLPDRLDLWGNWLSAYQRGEPATVLLYLDGMSFPDVLYELICDGSELYEIRRYIRKESTPIVYHSNYVLKNDFMYMAAPDIPEMKSNSTLFYKPVNREPIEYDIEALPILGTITAQQAIEIAKVRLIEHNHGLESVDQDVPYLISVSGAARLYGEVYYILESKCISMEAYSDRWHGTIAINANGGNQFLKTGGADDSLFLVYDSNMIKIQSNKKTAVEYLDQKSLSVPIQVVDAADSVTTAP